MLQTVRKWTQINQGQLGEPFGSISGFIDQFWGLWTAPKPNSGHSGQILTFPDPPCQLDQLKWSAQLPVIDLSPFPDLLKHCSLYILKKHELSYMVKNILF